MLKITAAALTLAATINADYNLVMHSLATQNFMLRPPKKAPKKLELF